jgi:outer membrane lipoprotein SlyB
MKMRMARIVVLFLFGISLGTGCASSTNRAGEGALIGGLLGAAGGAIIGNQSDRPGEGAGIGAAAGALTGALIGSQIQKQPQTGSQPAQSQQVVVNNPNQMSVQQIVDLSKSGVHEAVIIDRIRMTKSAFKLSAEDINSLKQQGVSQNVINAMQGL